MTSTWFKRTAAGIGASCLAITLATAAMAEPMALLDRNGARVAI